MRVADFHFDLPESLIARHPLAERRASRLLQLDGSSGELRHGQFTDLLGHLRAGDLMVFNNTRVIPARLFGQKASGGRIEVLVERVLDQHRVLAHVRASKSPKPDSSILIDGGGDIRAEGTSAAGEPWAVGVGDGLAIRLSAGAVCTSSTQQPVAFTVARAFPRTCRPSSRAKAAPVTVVRPASRR